MLEHISEKVSVIAVYDAGKGTAMPWRFSWHGRTITISKLGLHHTTYYGRALQHIFSVTDGSLAFRFRLDTETLQWTLEEVSDGTSS
jgi:hypothetical protein